MIAEFHLQGKQFSFNKKGSKPRIINSQGSSMLFYIRTNVPGKISIPDVNPTQISTGSKWGWGELRSIFRNIKLYNALSISKEVAAYPKFKFNGSLS